MRDFLPVHKGGLFLSDKPFLCQFVDDVNILSTDKRANADFRKFLTSDLRIFKPSEKISNKLILILARRSDRESDYVGIGLIRRGVDYVRLDIEDIPDLLRVRYCIKRGIASIKFRLDEREIDVANVSAVYLRNFEIEAIKFKGGKLSQTFSFEQWKDTYRILQANLKCAWVNNPDVTRLANDRVQQLSVAKAVGLDIPETVITNDPEMAKDFYHIHRGRIIIKALHHHAVQVGNRLYSMYTHKMTNKDLSHLDDLVDAPCILQEKLLKKSDLRITVVGKQIFAVEIDSQSTSKGRDDLHRCSLLELPKRIIKLKKADRDKCIKLLDSFGLQYGTIDLVRDRSDRLIFLEINPTGDWLWIEQHTGLPITDAMTDLLENCIECR
jgi:glutathione synthase/RimK-type ligase-like ATP-grasp enzyme